MECKGNNANQGQKEVVEYISKGNMSVTDGAGEHDDFWFWMTGEGDNQNQTPKEMA